MSFSKISTNSSTPLTKTSPKIKYLPFHSADLLTQGRRMVPILCSPLRQICSLLQNPGGLLRPDGTPTKENAPQGYALINHASSCRAQTQSHPL